MQGMGIMYYILPTALKASLRSPDISRSMEFMISRWEIWGGEVGVLREGSGDIGICERGVV